MKLNLLFKSNLVFLFLIITIYLKQINSMKFELSERMLQQIKNFSIVNISKLNNKSHPFENIKPNNLIPTKKIEKNVESDLANLNNKINRINELIIRYEKFNNFTKNNFLYDKSKFRFESVSSTIDNKNRSESKPKEIHAAISIIDEMEKNSDQREHLYRYQIYLILSFVINMFMNFTWKLSRKHKKFPSNLINNLFFAYNIKLLLILIMQSIKRDPLFEKIAFTVYILLDYFTILVNIFYLISVISLSLSRKIKTYTTVKLYVKNLFGTLLVILQMVFLLIAFFGKLAMKNCFIGACLVNFDLKYYLEVLPRFFEAFIIIFLILFYFINCCFCSKKDKSELSPSYDLVIETSSIVKVILYEIFYVFICALESGIKYYKIFYFNLYRFEDYCSVHDYMIIFKSFLLFGFLGVSFKHLEEWIKAFHYYEQFKDDDMVMINAIIQSKDKYFEKRNKNLI